MATRINKYLAEQGVASRRVIDMMIAAGRIAVNDVPLKKPGMIVRETDTITIDGKRITQRIGKGHMYILLNKPVGCLTTVRDTHGRKTVFDYVHVKERIFPIGRLDKDTTGLLLLTNDGELANKLMHPRHGIEKVYRAFLDKPLGIGDKKRFESGVMLDGKKTMLCTTRFFHNNSRDVIITLHEGRNRQIHRMFNTLGYRVQKLDRISYAGLTAGRLARGEWQFLSKQEIRGLQSLWKRKI